MARKKKKYLILNLESKEFEIVDSVEDVETFVSSMVIEKKWDEDTLRKTIKIHNITNLKEQAFTFLKDMAMRPKVKEGADYYNVDEFAPPDDHWEATEWPNISCCGKSRNIIYLPKTWKQDFEDMQQKVRDYFKKHNISFIESRGQRSREEEGTLVLINVPGEDNNTHLAYLDEKDVVLIQSLVADFRAPEEERIIQAQVMIDGSYTYVLLWALSEKMKVVDTLDQALDWLIS